MRFYRVTHGVLQTARGKEQGRLAGQKIKETMEGDGKDDYKLFFYTSPYRRSFETYEAIWCVSAGHASVAAGKRRPALPVLLPSKIQADFCLVLHLFGYLIACYSIMGWDVSPA